VIPKALKNGPTWVVATRLTTQRWAAVMRTAGQLPYMLAWGTSRDLATHADLDAALARVSPDLLLLTSAESLAFLDEKPLPPLRAACVGPATAAVADSHGLEVVALGHGGIAQLMHELLLLRPEPKRVLWLRGREARPEGAALLRASGATVEELVTYAVEPDVDFQERVRAAPEPAGVAVGSPRAVDALVAALRGLARTLPERIPFLLPGSTTGEYLAEVGLGAHPQLAVWGVVVDRKKPR
jgi:uroporphyrinogen-III synthase